jgi:Ca2+-binding EF-hand superfamily protein
LYQKIKYKYLEAKSEKKNKDNHYDTFQIMEINNDGLINTATFNNILHYGYNKTKTTFVCYSYNMDNTSNHYL